MATPDINKAYQWAINTCNAPNVGYSMNTSWREGLTVNGITYYDCSSFIFYALKNGGFPVSGSAFTTRSMIPILLNLGFTEKPIGGEWVAGDILWRSGHTEMVYQGGIAQGYTMGAHTDEFPLAEQVSIYTSPSPAGDWQRLFRYGNGATGGYGSSLYVIAAICGNWYQESQINPGLWEGQTAGNWTDMYKGYGLGQWTNTGTTPDATLLINLHDYMTQHGYAMDDGNGQVAFFFDEDRWNTDVNPIWRTDFPDLEAFLKSSSNNIDDLTHAFMNCWEGLIDSSSQAVLSTRQQFAHEFYNYLSQNYNLPVTQWYTSDGYITVEQSRNNAIMLYRLFSAGAGGGGNIQPDYNTMNIPLYMLFRKRKIIDIRL